MGDCLDRYCGALDCGNCYPGREEPPQCVKCDEYIGDNEFTLRVCEFDKLVCEKCYVKLRRRG